jgi:hypothetical protein
MEVGLGSQPGSRLNRLTQHSSVASASNLEPSNANSQQRSRRENDHALPSRTERLSEIKYTNHSIHTNPPRWFADSKLVKMGLEAVMLVVDNSESSRNGDYTPTRYDAQCDAANIIFQNVVQGNAESSVGLMSMGGKGPEVLATLTSDQGKILEGLHQTKKKIRGSAHLSTGIQIASVSFCKEIYDAQECRLTSGATNSWHSSTVRTSPSGRASSSSSALPFRKARKNLLFSPGR